MLDFNHRPTLSESMTVLVDSALQEKQSQQTPRDYLGASRLGVACDRALQYEYLHVAVDPGRAFPGKILRIFEAGHVFEDLAIEWLRAAGFTLLTENDTGGQFGFSAANGRLKGHIDGVITDGPRELNLPYPMLWECKSLSHASWKDTVKRKVAKSKPVYASQMAIYQAYMEPQVKGISESPALFTAINKNTAELYFEAVPFDGQLAQQSSDRGVRVILACEAHELLPRMTRDPSHFQCQYCAWQDRCWSDAA